MNSSYSIMTTNDAYGVCVIAKNWRIVFKLFEQYLIFRRGTKKKDILEVVSCSFVNLNGMDVI